MTRIFFACDAHGSVPVLKKMAKAGETYKCEVVMLAGDLTGKAVVPIVEERPGIWWSAPYGTKEKYKSDQDLNRAKDLFERRGFYWFLTTESELHELQSEPQKVQDLFAKLMIERMRDWLQLLEEKVPSDVKIIVNPGNDDHPAIDDLIRASSRVIYPLEKVVEIDETHPMISCEYVNTTPWGTPRECPDEELKGMLQREFDRVESYENLICNFHAPPFGTRIDLAPKLDDKQSVRVRFGGVAMVPVGSKAVRELFEEHQPLLGLHGHIHESAGIEYIGRTLCVNSGSAYLQGMLNAFLVDLPSKPNDKVEVLNVSA